MSLLRNIYKLKTLHRIPHGCRQISDNATLQYEKDPQPLFTDAETQRLLQSMTQLQLEKVFRRRTVADNYSETKFMTTAQLEKEFSLTIEKAKHQLQMPPVVKIKSDTARIISEDSSIKDFSKTKFVFTDITYGLRQSERKVVVRETDGTLAYASLDTTKRMNQLYFPLEGRKSHTPRMFADEQHLKRCLDEHKYEFILDRLTVQYEPYEADFHNISAKVFQHLMESKEFDTLRSTRHFGPMAFFYAWHRCIDDLVYDMIRRDYLKNAVELIALSYKIHKVPVEYQSTLTKLAELQPTSEERALDQLRSCLKPKAERETTAQEIEAAIGKTEQDFAADEICLKFIDSYIASEHSLKKVQLELAIQTLKELNMEKLQLYHGLKKAHGVQTS